MARCPFRRGVRSTGRGTSSSSTAGTPGWKFDNSGAFLSKWGSPGYGDGQFQGPVFVAVDGSGNVFVTDGNSNRVQKFGPATFDLTVSATGTGTGLVASAPPGIDCGATCSASFDRNTSVTLTATPTVGSAFAGWGGDCSGVDPCQLTMSAVSSVTATFDRAATEPPPPFVLTWGTNGPGDGQFSYPVGVAVDVVGQRLRGRHGKPSDPEVRQQRRLRVGVGNAGFGSRPVQLPVDDGGRRCRQRLRLRLRQRSDPEVRQRREFPVDVGHERYGCW